MLLTNLILHQLAPATALFWFWTVFCSGSNKVHYANSESKCPAMAGHSDQGRQDGVSVQAARAESHLERLWPHDGEANSHGVFSAKDNCG